MFNLISPPVYLWFIYPGYIIIIVGEGHEINS